MSSAAALLLLIAASAAGAQDPPAPVPVLVDTDIGSDIDDAFALAVLLSCPEIEIRAITTSGPESLQRALMVGRLLTAIDREDIPVAYGRMPQPGTDLDGQRHYARHPAVLYSRSLRPLEKKAEDLLLDTLKRAPATIVALGPLNTIERLVERHPDIRPRIQGVVVCPAREGSPILDDAQRDRLFAHRSPLTLQIQALHQMRGGGPIPLNGAAALLKVIPRPKKPFGEWCVGRILARDKPAPPGPPGNASTLVKRGGLPRRVHVVEDFETDIEKKWWLSGRVEPDEAAPGRGRACHGMLTMDFDGKMGNTKTMYTAVVFNPVPGPPMGPDTRLAFRYKLTGADALRCQIFSLSKGYHRYLSVKGLRRGEWTEATVDLTKTRRPDGSGGPLSEDERIDDIQFYTDPGAELWIDDIVLYDAAADGGGPFPRRVVFTGGFDTGKQGREWPGDFRIVANGKDRPWNSAEAVQNPESGAPWIRVGMRGSRPTGGRMRLRFEYRLSGGTLKVGLADTSSGRVRSAVVEKPVTGAWAAASVEFEGGGRADEIRFFAEPGRELRVDDVLLYEPGE